MLFEQIIGIVSSHVLNAFKVGGGSLSLPHRHQHVGPRRRQRAAASVMPMPAVAAPCANRVSPVPCAARYWERTWFCRFTICTCGAPLFHTSALQLRCVGHLRCPSPLLPLLFPVPPFLLFLFLSPLPPPFLLLSGERARAFAPVISQLPSCASCCTMRVARCLLRDACCAMRVA